MGHPTTNAPSHLTWQNCIPSTPSEMGRFSRWYCLSGSMRGTCCPRSDLWETTDNIITTDGRRGKEGEEERKESEEGKSYMGRRWWRTGTSVRAACERAEMQKAGGRRVRFARVRAGVVWSPRLLFPSGGGGGYTCRCLLGDVQPSKCPKRRSGAKMLECLAHSSFSMFTPVDSRPGVGREHLVTEADGGSGMVAGTEA